MIDMNFYRGKKVLVTGHTGFKGSWLCKMLILSGAEVTGYSLSPSNSQNLFSLVDIESQMCSIIGDVRDFSHLEKVFAATRPEIVFHLAAQPLVRESYQNPIYTYETNVMGTVHVCECVRKTSSVKSFLNVTTDKVYKNREWEWGYRENDPLDGYDPYSNSKSCSELVTHSYINSFFSQLEIPASTARAGNVIGGGDFACDRIIPDCVRAISNQEDIIVRNPHSVRPYQHVLEPLVAYLLIVAKQYESMEYAGFYNVGPDDNDCITTGELVSLFCQSWGNNIRWITKNNQGPHEANYLKLDCSKLKKVFGWNSRWHIDDAVRKTVEWYKVYMEAGDLSECMDKQISDYLKG